MLLHTLNASPASSAFADCLRLLRNGDAVLLGGDGDGDAVGMQHEPSVSAVLCNRSMALLKLGRNEEALVDAVRAVFVDSQSLKPRYRHACALKARGRGMCMR